MVRVYIVGFNHQKRVNRAIASIPDAYDKILLDNGSIALKAPEGVEHYAIGPGMFTAAFNWAIQDALDKKAIPVICNDDIQFEDGCIEALIREIHNGAGLACPIQVDMAVPDRVIMGGTNEAYPAGIHRLCQREFIDRNLDYPWLPFCVVAVNPAMVDEVGILDNNLKMWFSDSDYSIRVRNAGFSVTLVHDAIVRHEQSAAVNSSRSEKLQLQFILDQQYFVRKYGGQILEEYK